MSSFVSQVLGFHSTECGTVSISGVMTTASSGYHPSPSSLSMSRSAYIAERECSIGEVLMGKAPARENEEEITLFDALGLAVEDIVCAKYLCTGIE